MYEIIHRYNNSVLYRSEDAATLRQAVEAAVRSGADLRGASLDGADLRGASLRRASLDDASLVGASLDGASLDGASLVAAILDDASLVGASLDGASLRGAILDGASLRSTSLVGASLDSARVCRASLHRAILDGAILDGASLDGTKLDEIRDDLYAVLDAVPAEVPGLLAALREGHVDGYSGLIATVANVRGCAYDELGDLRPNSDRPAEEWFSGIRWGDTPQKSPIARLTVGWVEEWLARDRRVTRYTWQTPRGTVYVDHYPHGTDVHPGRGMLVSGTCTDYRAPSMQRYRRDVREALAATQAILAEAREDGGAS